MADDLKSKRCKLEETAMARFSDDLILEIVRRLPLKYDAGIAVVKAHGFYWGDLVGLAVLDNSRFKLVSVEVDIATKCLKFTVFVPSARSGESISVESRINFACLERLTLMTGDGVQPVYAHGALYWLGNDGRSMVAFDVEKEEVRIVGGPVEGDELSRFCKWFGFADGSLHLVYASPLEIVIRQYDHVSRRWRVRCTIPNICNPRNNNFEHGKPVFFDGRRLVFVLRKNGEFGRVYTYDFVRDLWEMIMSFAAWPRWHEKYYSYSPTFVKVSDTYLSGKNTSSWENEGRRNSLLELQKLLIPE